MFEFSNNDTIQYSTINSNSYLNLLTIFFYYLNFPNNESLIFLANNHFMNLYFEWPLTLQKI